MRKVLKQPLVNLTRTNQNNFWSNGPEVHTARFTGSLLVQWTRSGPIIVLIKKNSIRDRSYCSASFGRNISDEVKLSSADDMGVWNSLPNCMQL